MTLHFLDYVFGLNLALEPPQRALDRLAFLQSDFCQIITPGELYLSLRYLPDESDRRPQHLDLTEALTVSTLAGGKPRSTPASHF